MKDLTLFILNEKSNGVFIRGAQYELACFDSKFEFHLREHLESVCLSSKADHDFIQREAEVMDDFIPERQRPTEIRAGPTLQMAS